MSFTEALESAARAAAERVNINEGDYIGEDGLLHCASCHKNKQTKIVIGGKERVVYCICDCREAELAAEKAERKKIRDKAEQIFRKYGVVSVEVSRESEIIDRTVELFARGRGRKAGFS